MGSKFKAICKGIRLGIEYGRYQEIMSWQWKTYVNDQLLKDFESSSTWPSNTAEWKQSSIHSNTVKHSNTVPLTYMVFIGLSPSLHTCAFHLCNPLRHIHEMLYTNLAVNLMAWDSSAQATSHRQMTQHLSNKDDTGFVEMNFGRIQRWVIFCSINVTAHSRSRKNSSPLIVWVSHGAVSCTLSQTEVI